MIVVDSSALIAVLKLCDSAAYALAKTMNAPLLFKGYDFTQTDLQSCV